MKRLLYLAIVIFSGPLFAADVNIINIPKTTVMLSSYYVLGITNNVARLIPATALANFVTNYFQFPAGIAVAAGTGLSAETNSSLVTLGSAPPGVTNVSTTYTANTNYTIIAANTTSAAFILTLPAVFTEGLYFQIKNIGANTLTITNQLGQTIDGALSLTLGIKWQARTLYRVGTNWLIF